MEDGLGNYLCGCMRISEESGIMSHKEDDLGILGELRGIKEN